jgi:hypothetical protein
MSGKASRRNSVDCVDGWIRLGGGHTSGPVKEVIRDLRMVSLQYNRIDPALVVAEVRARVTMLAQNFA